MQLDLLDINGKATKQSVTVDWFPIESVKPSDDNPRLSLEQDIVDGLVEVIQADGLGKIPAISVRPVDGFYEVVDGHHRLEAATRAGCKSVLCMVLEIDDTEAVIQRWLLNQQTAFKDIEKCLYFWKHTQKDSKLGFSRTALAKRLGLSEPRGRQLANAGEVAAQSVVDYGLLKGRSTHLNEIRKASKADWPWLISQMLASDWSVKDTEAAVAAITGLPEIPEWLQPVFDPDQCKRKAIQEERAVRDYNNWITTAIAEYEQLAEERPVNTVKDDKHVVEYWDLRSLFVQQLLTMKNPSAKRITECAAAVMEQIDKAENVYQQWLASKANDEEKRRIAEENQKRERLLKLKFAPTGYQGDIREVLPKLEAESFDLVLTDPPYLLSNGGITCRGNSQTTVDKNFSDTEGEAVEPKDWMPECYRLLKPGGVLVFTLTSHLMASALQTAKEVGFEFLEDLIWAKRSAPPRLTPTGHRACHEYVLVFCKPGASHYFAYEHLTDKYWDGKQPSAVLEFEQCSGKERLGWHDTQKPLGLWTYLLEAYSRQEATVLDPFGGSGTTAVAAKQTNRLCTWVELSPGFFEQAESRIEQTKFAWEQA